MINSAIISSVNYDYTSFEENREAGIVIGGSDAAPLHAFLTKMFELDVQLGLPWQTQSYNASVMAIINDKSSVPVVLPPKKPYQGAYTSKQTKVVGNFFFGCLWIFSLLKLFCLCFLFFCFCLCSIVWVYYNCFCFFFFLLFFYCLLFWLIVVLIVVIVI